MSLDNHTAPVGRAASCLNKSTNPHTSKRRGRWLAASCGCDYTWMYRRGRVNVGDPISRVPQLLALVCARTATAHSLKAFCRGRDQGVACVASGLTSEGAPRTALCCHVYACSEPTASVLPNRMLAAQIVPRDAGPDAVERPAELPRPPQTAAGWRSSRSRKLSHGGSDTPAVEPAEKPKKRKRVTVVDPEVEQLDLEPTMNLGQPPAEPSVDADEASWA